MMPVDTQGQTSYPPGVTPAPASLRERKKLETRLALARSALRLFEERGYAETSVDDIAAAANVSRRTFFRYFRAKDEVVIVDPEGKLRALHVALAEGPPDEPTIAALRRGILALTEAYFEPDIIRSVARVGMAEPSLAATAMAYQVHWEDELAREVAADLGVDVTRRSTAAHRGPHHGRHHARRVRGLAPGRVAGLTRGCGRHHLRQRGASPGGHPGHARPLRRVGLPLLRRGRRVAGGVRQPAGEDDVVEGGVEALAAAGRVDRRPIEPEQRAGREVVEHRDAIHPDHYAVRIRARDGALDGHPVARS